MLLLLRCGSSERLSSLRDWQVAARPAILPRLKEAGSGLLQKLNRSIRNRVDRATTAEAVTEERDEFIGFWDEHWGI